MLRYDTVEDLESSSQYIQTSLKNFLEKMLTLQFTMAIAMVSLIAACIIKSLLITLFPNTFF